MNTKLQPSAAVLQRRVKELEEENEELRDQLGAISDIVGNGDEADADDDDEGDPDLDDLDDEIDDEDDDDVDGEDEDEVAELCVDDEP